MSLVRGDKARAMLARTFGDDWIEELPLDFYCASCDVRHSELVIHRHGLLREAATASICLPVLGEPRSAPGGRLLVDGSVLNNLPVENMATTGEGPIIAVDIKLGGGGGTPTSTQSAGPDPRRATMGDVRSPTMLETLARVVLLGSSNTSKAAAEHADLVITPRSHGIGLLEFHQLDTARDAGRRAAEAALEVAPDGLFG